MVVTRSEKETEIRDLSAAFEGAESAILLDYKGLNVPQVTELRRQVRAVRAEYRVVKNTLAKRALKDTPFEPLSPFLQGTTAVALSRADPVALAKVLTTFAKATPALTIKAAIVEGRAIRPSEVNELAALPGKSALVAKLLRVFQAPMVRLLSVLNAAPRGLLSVLVQAEKKKS